MEVTDLALSGLKLIKPRVFRDERGFFFESYREELYAVQGIPTFVQDNVSLSCKNTIRGLHFQSHPGQAKLISCVQGTIWDIVLDIRPESPTFMKWNAVELDDQMHQQLYVPLGFAHGFCVLSPTARVHYKVSAPYNPRTEMSIRWNDASLNIPWPTTTPILAPRDQTSPYFHEVIDVLDHRR